MSDLNDDHLLAYPQLNKETIRPGEKMLEPAVGIEPTTC